MRLRVSDIAARVAKVTNLSSTDTRVINFINAAQERLLYSGNWQGTKDRYQICTSNKCLVWPREIETILACWRCDSPVTLRGEFYEALGNGTGLANDESCGPCLTMLDRGECVAFDEVPETGYKLAIYADGTESAGTVLVRYYDSTGNKVYTTYLGSVIEGERLTIPAAGNYTVSTYECLPAGVYHVEKPVTNRNIRFYARKITDNSLWPLSVYEPDEQVPVYRKSYLPDLANNGGDCEETRVTVLAKLRFIPAVNFGSMLMISHGEAIKLGCQALYKEDSNDFAGALTLWTMAEKLLDDQLANHRGSGQVDPVRMISSSVWGGGVGNIV